MAAIDVHAKCKGKCRSGAIYDPVLGDVLDDEEKATFCALHRSRRKVHGTVSDMAPGMINDWLDHDDRLDIATDSALGMKFAGPSVRWNGGWLKNVAAKKLTARLPTEEYLVGLCPSVTSRKGKCHCNHIIVIKDFIEANFPRDSEIFLKLMTKHDQTMMRIMKNRYNRVTFCPEARCPGAGGIIVSSTFSSHALDGKMMSCPYCSLTWCFECGAVPYHHDQRCSAASRMRRLREEAKRDPDFAATLRHLMEDGSTMLCPSCGEGVQKEYGCDHMTCISCRAHFCWICSKIFVDGDPYGSHIRFDPDTNDYVCSGGIGRRPDHLRAHRRVLADALLGDGDGGGEGVAAAAAAPGPITEPPGPGGDPW
jgi:hypothetical protein